MPKKKVHVEARSKQKRIEQRQALGSLKSLTVQPKTRKRYDAALDLFFKYLRAEGLQLPRQRAHFDDILSDYLEHLWSQGEGRALAADTVAGLQDADPKLRNHLPCTWRLMKVWVRNEMPARAPPFPESVVGYSLFKEDPLFALSLLLGFYGMMRTGEIIGLQRHQVEISCEEGPAIISLGLTKSGKRHGAEESITISVFEVPRRLFQWKRSRVTNLVSSAYQWRTKFAQYTHAVGLIEFEFRPYSLRRGGATFWFARHGSFDRLLIQGRWSAVKTAKIYINSGLAILAEMKLPVSKMQGFTSIYRKSVHKSLPSLEHTRKPSGSGGRGKNGKRRPKKEFLLG